MTIGVLAVQGAFIEHIQKLNKLGVDCFEIRQKRDLGRVMDGIILPGGESTTMEKLLSDLGMKEELKSKISSGLPVFGTCAGAILLAKKIVGENNSHLATMDVTVKRNAYGRQLGSFYTEENFKGIGKIPMTFIRAPYIDEVSDNVEILAVANGKIVAARQGNQLVTSFHPELNDDLSVHRYFLKMAGYEA